MNAAPGLMFVFLGICIPLPVALLLGAGMYFCWRAIQNNKKKSQALAEAPMVQIDELGVGLHKIKGKVRGQEDPLRSPLTRKKCVYFRFHVEELRTQSHGKHGHSTHWVTVVDDKQWIDLTIEDKTGVIEIDLAKAEVTLTTKGFTSSGTFDGASDELEDLMNTRYGKSTKGWIFNKSMRYTESYLRDGDKVLVVGDVKKKKGFAPEFTKGENPLLVTDMQEKQLGRLYAGKTTMYWVLLCLLGFFALAFCGAGGLFSLIGLGVAGLGASLPNAPQVGKKDDAIKLLAKPRPINPAWNDTKMASSFLSDMQEENVKLGWGRFGKNGRLGYGRPGGGDDEPIVVAGRPSPKGLSFHPPDGGESVVQYRLNRQSKIFKAQIALQDFPPGTDRSDSPLTFKVFGDGDLLWYSDPPLQGRIDRQDIRISVENVEVLELRVHCPGNKRFAWPVWLNPHVLK